MEENAIPNGENPPGIFAADSSVRRLREELRLQQPPKWQCAETIGMQPAFQLLVLSNVWRV